LKAIDELAERLRPHYSRFLGDKAGQILLTGHSHQAWPDVCREAQLEAFDDAAKWVDDKWGKIFGEVLPEFQRLVAKRIGSSRPNDLALAPNTHELVYRLHSCFDGAKSVVTTDAEFHSMSRQLGRLAEDGLAWIKVPVGDDDGDRYAARFLEAVDRHRPAWCGLSLVLFTSARALDVAPILKGLAERDVPVLIDAYHAFNVVPFSSDQWPGTVFVTGGGYKYAQSGEGACWLLAPADARRFRPRQTGWFADFAHLESATATIQYGDGGQRFFGATFDPTPFYRARAALRFFDAEGLDVTTLSRAARLRTTMIVDEHGRLGLGARGLTLVSPSVAEARGGFVAFGHPRAGELKTALKARGIWADHRGEILRLGPAPYTTSTEIRLAMEALTSIL
jgi:kynureninase